MRSTPPARALAAVAAAAAVAAPAGPAAAQAPAFTVLMVRGDVQAEGGAALRVGQPFAGGAVRTGADGQLQLRSASGSFVALAPGSQARLATDGSSSLALSAGGLRLAPAGEPWKVDLPERSIRTNGFLKLQFCGAGCPDTPGLYGRIVQGEAVLEYAGGRSVLRTRSFRWPGADTRPEVLPQPPAWLDDTSALAGAAQVREGISAQLARAIEAFRNGDDATATQGLQAVGQLAPGETLVGYYLGLIALKREDNENALRLLQQYAREDPEGAGVREVPKTLTLLASAQLQQEVATAVAREKDVAAAPPEPGSIAVQAFVNKGNEAYRAMAKGLAAMIIADLNKVPGLKVLEREKVQLLVNEAKLGDSGLADTASAVRSGRLMRAEKVVVGNFEVQ